MKRRTLATIGLASLLTAGGSPAERHGSLGGPDFRDLVLAPAVSDNLALLFGKFDTELVLCLEGERRGPDLHVTDFRMPHIFVSEAGRVQAASCDGGPRSIGTWHNHPPASYRLMSAGSHSLARNCYLSQTDINDFRRREEALVAVVSCDVRTYAYWRRDDLPEHDEDDMLLAPINRQFVRASFYGEGGVPRVTQARER